MEALLTRNKAHKHIGFPALSRKIAARYRAKGYGAKRASYIGRATAGKVAREKKRTR